jgi:nitrite reductase/ring-hydroxylating ferredoxin subunit
MLAFDLMLDRILGLFGSKPVVVRGTGKLPEGQARKVEFGDVLAGTGKQIVLCRVGGELHALDALCPHEGGRIVEGPLVEGRFALCPLHNYRFDPKTGKAQGVVCRDAKRYKVKEKDGDCELWL